MALNFKRKVVLAKIEAVYGTDIVPGNADAVSLKDVTIDALAGERVTRDLLNQNLGARAKALVGRHVTLQAKVELSAGGAAGDKPGWDVIARICGHAATVTEDTDVVYKPRDSNYEAGSIYINVDGNRHKMLGARGTATWRLAWGQLPELEVNLIGIWAQDAAAALPAADYSAWQAPFIVSKDNTPTFTIDGYAAVGESIELVQANDVAFLERINRRDVPIRDRTVALNTTIEAPAFGTKNFHAMVGGAPVVVALVHGVGAGNIIQFDIPEFQIDNAPYADGRGDTMLSMTGVCLPTDAGASDYTITVK